MYKFVSLTISILQPESSIDRLHSTHSPACQSSHHSQSQNLELCNLTHCNNSMRILCSTSNIHQPMYYSTYSIQRTIYHRPPPMCQDNWNHQQCKMASWWLCNLQVLQNFVMNVARHTSEKRLSSAQNVARSGWDCDSWTQVNWCGIGSFESVHSVENVNCTRVFPSKCLSILLTLFLVTRWFKFVEFAASWSKINSCLCASSFEL
jgi:hypothetical protein